MKKAYTYDDIQLVPQYSEVESRRDVKLKTRLSRNFNIIIPYVASPMDTICENHMAIKMMNLGGVGCLHRFMSIEDQANAVGSVDFIASTEQSINTIWAFDKVPVMAAIGSNGDYMERAIELQREGANVLLIDVAHGHHKNVKEAIRNIKSRLPVDVIAGNVATYDGARDLVDWGADGVRCGIGGGSLCSTRVQTGHGIPNVTSLIECALGIESTGQDVPLMADGGLRSSGDISKAIAVGANNVMLGSLLAGTQETPGPVIENGNQLFKRYRGSASLETKSTHGQEKRNVEGESTVVPFKGGVKFVIERLNDGLRSALSYTGAHSIDEFHLKSDWVEVTNAGITEAKPHLIK